LVTGFDEFGDLRGGSQVSTGQKGEHKRRKEANTNLVESSVVEVRPTEHASGLALDSEEVLLERDGTERGVEEEEAGVAVDADNERGNGSTKCSKERKRGNGWREAE
jgi:hypothetical protein